MVCFGRAGPRFAGRWIFYIMAASIPFVQCGVKILLTIVLPSTGFRLNMAFVKVTTRVRNLRSRVKRPKLLSGIDLAMIADL